MTHPSPTSSVLADPVSLPAFVNGRFNRWSGNPSEEGQAFIAGLPERFHAVHFSVERRFLDVLQKLGLPFPWNPLRTKVTVELPAAACALEAPTIEASGRVEEGERRKGTFGVAPTVSCELWVESHTIDGRAADFIVVSAFQEAGADKRSLSALMGMLCDLTSPSTTRDLHAVLHLQKPGPLSTEAVSSPNGSLD